MLPSFIILSVLFSSLVHAEFDWQAHRGGRGLYPENSIFAMNEVLKYPVTTLELDVVISKDQQVVVSHEPWMSEEICLDPKGKEVKGREVNLFKLTFEEIRKYDCGSKVHPRFPRQQKAIVHKPLLKDLIRDLSFSKKYFNIEIKSTVEDERDGFQPEYKKFTDEVMAVVIKGLPEKNFSIQSFDWRVLKYLHEKYPKVAIVALRETAYTPKGVVEELGFAPTIFSPDFELLSASDVAAFHKLNIKVIPWTVNSPEVMNKMIAMHVDGIITDYPDLIAQIPAKSYQKPIKCNDKHNSFEGRCVKIPAHGEPSEQNPGWICQHGYLQKRSSCIKIKVPKHAQLAEDGKSWVCKSGYERYRFKCTKK